MSNLVYITDVIQKMRNVLEGIAVGRMSLQAGDADVRYKKTLKQLKLLKPLIGDVPDFLNDLNDGWDYWRYVKCYNTYEKRREFLRKYYDLHYEKVLGDYKELSAEQHLLQRDLVLEEEIGSGGFGVVHKATQVTLGALRAVKLFKPHFYKGEGKPIQRFAREASLLEKLSHPNIVRFYDAGIAGDQPFLVTEFIEGTDLNKLREANGNWAEHDVMKMCLDVLQALQNAHKEGIYHRDIKPSNILLSKGKHRIVDFGAGVAIEHQLTTRLTTTAVGTPGFIAPELQEKPTLLDARPDIYSVGATAHYMLTGRLPYSSATSRWLVTQGVSKELSEVIEKSLSSPEERFSSADSMAMEISPLV